MSKQIVRTSKYRHVFGTAFKREQCYENVNSVTSASDVNYIDGNGQYFAVAWRAGGGGSLCVLGYDKCGKLAPDVPVITGHTSEITDFAFNPFQDSLIASGSADTTVKLWQIPEGGLTSNMDTPLLDLTAHSRKISTLTWHPTADNLLASSAWDHTVKLFDISTGEEMINLAMHTDTIQCVQWNYDGSLMATTSKDKLMRLIDPRANAEVGSVQAHEGTKGSRVLFPGQKESILTVGFSKTSERQVHFWDPRNLSTRVAALDVDVSSGAFIPYYDEDSGLLFLAGKGDAAVKYFELVDEAPHIYHVSDFRAKDPQKGFCMLPKRAVDVGACELNRGLRLCNNLVEPVMFQVPRKGDHFQDDLFPDSRAGIASLSAADWASGQNKPPVLTTMKPGQQVERVAVVKKSPLQEANERIAALEAENEELKKKLAALGGN